MKGSRSGSQSGRSQGSALPVVLAVVVVLALGGLVLASVVGGSSASASEGSVYGTRFVKPKLSVDGTPPLVRRAPSFSVLVGTSKKKARWVTVGAVKYLTCDKGDRWTGTACISAKQASAVEPSWSARQVALVALGGLMLLVLVVGLAGGGSREHA